VSIFFSLNLESSGGAGSNYGYRKGRAKNAAILAEQILALVDSNLREKLAEFKKAQEKKVIKKDSAIQ